MKKVVVVGGGPAGMMAAIRAAQITPEVILIEKNPILGKKLLLSGKGRCNLTNDCDLDYFLERFSGQGQFLRDAFKKFFNRELVQFFETKGLPMKVERQQRVFPASDSSSSIVDVLKQELKRDKVQIHYGEWVKDIAIEDKRVRGVVLDGGRLIHADCVIMATGGASYSFTGSDGEGIELLHRLGHKVIPLRAGLVPLEVVQSYPRDLEGLVLKNIRLQFCDGKRKMVSSIGELLFTHKGISGPLVLSLSGEIVDWLKDNKKVYVEIDLKPALSKEQLDARILREYKAAPRKNAENILKALLPIRLASVFISAAGIPVGKKVNQVTLSERTNLVTLLKAWRMDIKGPAAFEQAMVTRGGVSLGDIDPRTMQSRKISGLYLCGEMIDVDADTGGFNLQAAFSTGYLAGESAALS